jgi:protein pelota
MKAEICELQRGFGEIRLFPENIDDIWHLVHLIRPGDLVFATTLRSTETVSDKIRPEKSEKRPVRLGIRVEKVEFHHYSNRLRVTGLIEHGVDTGSHHTLNIETGYDISVVKHWRTTDLERIERSIKASVSDVIHILTIEEGEAEIFRIRQYGPEPVISILGGSGKGAELNSRTQFFEQIAKEISAVTGPLVIAGPGFVKDDFLKYLKGVNTGRAGNSLVVETRRIGAGAVREVIGNGILEKLTGDLQLAREVNLMDEFLKRVSKGEPVAYGNEEVQRAAEYSAIEQLLVSDSRIHEPDVVRLMDSAEQSGAKIVIFSTIFDPGKQLDSLGGIAALLRYRV